MQIDSHINDKQVYICIEQNFEMEENLLSMDKL